jgi:hypothetical protein
MVRNDYRADGYMISTFGLTSRTVMDKDLKALRDDRWNRAFADHGDTCSYANMNRKATIVIEHIIQASDIAHTSRFEL